MGFLSPSVFPFQFGPLDAFIGSLCVAAIASVVIFILIAVWVYRDAETRGMDANIWAIAFVLAGFFVPFVGGLIVLIIYLIVRAEHPVLYAIGAPPPPPPPPPAPPASPQTCRNCGAPLRPGGAFCANCGSKV